MLQPRLPFQVSAEFKAVVVAGAEAEDRVAPAAVDTVDIATVAAVVDVVVAAVVVAANNQI
jgi:hypothetical protein